MARNPHHNGPIAKVADFGASAQMFMSSLQSGLIGTEDKAKKHVVTLTTWFDFFFFFFFFFLSIFFLSFFKKKKNKSINKLITFFSHTGWPPKF